jgi:hypothetical protein
METTKTVRFTYDKKGDNFFGQAEVPTSNGVLRFKAMVPMADVRMQVRAFLAKQPTDIAGDPVMVAKLPLVENRVAKERTKRRLVTAIRVKMGGPVRPFEVSGPAGFAHRIAQGAANRRSLYQAGCVSGDGDDVGAFGFLKKIGKGIGKGVKAVGKGVGKGVVATGKGIGKGAKVVGKGGYIVAKTAVKAGGKVISNPITGALLTAVPGGAAAAAIIAAARGGSPGAQQAIVQVTDAAQAGDAQAQASKAALDVAEASTPPPSAGPNKTLLIGGGLAAAAVGVYFMTRKS